MLPILKANLWLIILVSLLVALDVATGLGLLAAYWWVQQQVSVSRSLTVSTDGLGLSVTTARNPFSNQCPSLSIRFDSIGCGSHVIRGISHKNVNVYK